MSELRQLYDRKITSNGKIVCSDKQCGYIYDSRRKRVKDECMKVKIIGAGLAGCEAAWQLANQGISVELYEMRPYKMTPAHKTDKLSELVCSNSLKSNKLDNASGLLKEEMRLLRSLIIEAIDNNKIPAGSALAVDREGFASYITERINAHPISTCIVKRY